MTQQTNGRRRLRHGGLVCLTLTLSLWVICTTSACESLNGPTDVDPMAHARVYFVHDVAQLGAMQVMLDDEELVRLGNGETSNLLRVDVGTHRLSVRVPGASVGVFESEQLFAAQGYLIVFHDAPPSGVSSFIVDAAAPVPAIDEAVVAVASLFAGPQKFDVYLDTSVVARGVAHEDVTEFVVRPAGPQTLSVRNAGDESTKLPVILQDGTLDGEVPYLVLLQGSGMRLRADILPFSQ